MSVARRVDEDHVVALLHRPDTTTHAWAEAAACVGMKGDPYFPADGDEPTAAALRVCDGCPVASNCLASALLYEAADGLRYGWWGGLSPEEREQLWARLGHRLVKSPELSLSDPASIARQLRSERWTVKAIAGELGCTERTVYRYLAAPAA